MDDVRALYKSSHGYDVMTKFYDSSVAKLPIPVESLFVDTRWGKTHMLAAGPVDGPPLILIPGMACSAILWHLQFADFAHAHRVYALDVVGGPGRSAPNPPSLFDESPTEWVRDVLDGLDLERADFAGVSIGGWLIMRLGITHPNSIRKGVLISPLRLARAKLNVGRWVGNAIKPEKKDDSLVDRLSVREFSPSENKPTFSRHLARKMALATKHYRLGVAAGIPINGSRLKKVEVGLRVLQKFATPMSKKELTSLKTPVLVVMGEREMLYNSDSAARRARMIPNARVEVIPDTGHAAIFDRPDHVNPIILSYLEEPVTA